MEKRFANIQEQNIPIFTPIHPYVNFPVAESHRIFLSWISTGNQPKGASALEKK
jgi:hypothetical protein